MNERSGKGRIEENRKGREVETKGERQRRARKTREKEEERLKDLCARLGSSGCGGEEAMQGSGYVAPEGTRLQPAGGTGLRGRAKRKKQLKSLHMLVVVLRSCSLVVLLLLLLQNKK